MTHSVVDYAFAKAKYNKLPYYNAYRFSTDHKNR